MTGSVAKMGIREAAVLRDDHTGPEGRPLRVALIPYQGDRNPYLSLLATSLRDVGVEVMLIPGENLRKLRRRVEDSPRPDIVHLHWHHRFFVPRSGGWVRAARRTAGFFRQLLALREAGVSFVWTVHNIVNHERRYAKWERWACYLLARLVDRLVVHCPAAVSLVAAAYAIDAERIAVAAMGHYGDWYPPPPPREKARGDLGLSQDLRVFLFFGQVRQYKGLERLLSDFAALEDPRLRLLVLGQPRTAALARTLEDRAARDPRVVLELRFVPEERLVTHLSACDAVILPYSDSLTSGATVLAASHGRPVIAPRLGCMRDFPPDGGILYDPEELGALGHSLRTAVSAPLDEMGATAGRWAQEHPWSLAAAQLLGVYASVVRARGSGHPKKN